MLKKILIAVDGTDSGNRALEFGLDLAEKYSATVLLLNVLDVPVYSVPMDQVTLPAENVLVVKDLRKVHENILEKAAEYAANLKPNVTVKTELREGKPSDQIVLTATEDEFDIVIVGQGDKSKAQKLFLGSTSEKVVHTTPCTVVIVK